MQFCLYDHEYGYYCTRNPFGLTGDFITSPSICPLFGECLGIFVIHAWESLGKPQNFELIEMGAGQGVMMNDMLRIIKQTPQCYAACHVQIVEISHYLQKQQAHNVHSHIHKIRWSNTLLKDKSIMKIFVSNEFFDALPVRQFVVDDTEIYEKYVLYNAEKDCFYEDNFIIDHKNIPVMLRKKIDHIQGQKPYVIEYNAFSDYHIRAISNTLSTSKGLCLIVDYGYNDPHAYGNSFQSIKNNNYSKIFSDIGTSDYTSHVDFDMLIKAASHSDMHSGNVLTQNEFLCKMGINQLLTHYAQHIDKNALKDLTERKERITDTQTPSSMGNIFKCLYISDKETPIMYPFN